MIAMIIVQLYWLLFTLWLTTTDAFSHAKSLGNGRGQSFLKALEGSEADRPAAFLVGIVNEDEAANFRSVLENAGFGTVVSEFEDATSIAETNFYRYKFSKATGMLQLIGSPPNSSQHPSSHNVPSWVPIVRDMEHVLVENGWSLFDPDENEPLSSFDIDAANRESLYKPKWGHTLSVEKEDFILLSSLGYDVTRMTSEQVLALAAHLHGDIARETLLNGGTDPQNLKRTHNGVDFRGAAGQTDLDHGIFFCAIGGLPLFSTLDLSPTTASSGWLSFSRPLSDDHVVLISPHPDSDDRRIEVVCAKSRCHLGHYFGRGEGYCINASTLDFVKETEKAPVYPTSWRALEGPLSSASAKQLHYTLLSTARTEKVAFGAGCFWHVEAALRRLPGIVETTAGFAGGTTSNPTYEDVCHQSTDHAEVVLVEFDPNVMNIRTLVDSFFVIHNPTTVRAHGKHAAGSGQYRSCIFLANPDHKSLAREALNDCQSQLQKELSTELRAYGSDLTQWFWRAEDKHQRYQEQRNEGKLLSTLSTTQWLEEYGKRSLSIIGSAETNQLFR
jgi:peptide-methionine (S)-S-oxide reductase